MHTWSDTFLNMHICKQIKPSETQRERPFWKNLEKKRSCGHRRSISARAREPQTGGSSLRRSSTRSALGLEPRMESLRCLRKSCVRPANCNPHTMAKSNVRDPKALSWTQGDLRTRGNRHMDELLRCPSRLARIRRTKLLLQRSICAGDRLCYLKSYYRADRDQAVDPGSTAQSETHPETSAGVMGRSDPTEDAGTVGEPFEEGRILTP